jgi:hypothetical protein
MDHITRTQRIRKILRKDGGWMCRSQLYKRLGRNGGADARHISQYINNMLLAGWLQRRKAPHPERTRQLVYFYKLRKKQLDWYA